MKKPRILTRTILVNTYSNQTGKQKLREPTYESSR